MPKTTNRRATSRDVPLMLACRITDPDAGPGDPRMAAYLEGEHHPQHALPPRTAYVAIHDEDVVGYIAGHLTRRFNCDGELQYLYVAREHRRQGVAVGLLRCLSDWFLEQGARRVCVNVDVESAAAASFYLSQGAVPLAKHWYVWDDIAG